MMAPLPPPPAPPPPPMNFTGHSTVNVPSKTSPAKANSNSGTDRNALLQEIRGGARLKKTVTNDRSQPLIDGKSNMSSNSTPQVGGGGGIKSPNGIVNGGPPNLGGLFSQGMPKLRSTGKFITARDEAEDSVSKSIAAQSARETSSLSGTPKRTANSASSGTPINKSPINSNTNSTIKASLEAQFQLQNGIHRNGSGNNSSSLNNNNINNKNYNTKFNTISTTRSQQSQWKVSPTANSSDLPNQQTHSPVNSYSKGPAPSVPSNMATDSSPISAQVTSNNNRPGTVNRSKSVGKPSQRPAHPAVRPPPPPKTTGINAVTLQSNTTSIPVNLSQSSINSFVSRRTSLDPSSVAEEGSTTVAPVSNKPPPPPRNLPVTHGPPPPLAPHGRATGNTGLASGLSKSQSSINGPSRPSAPPPPPPPHSRTPSTVSVSSSNLSNILKPSYPAPPPPAPLGQNSSNRTLGTLGQTNGASGTTSNPSRVDLATRFSLQFKDLVTLPRPDPMTKTNKQYASVIYQAKQQSRESAHHC